MKVVYGHTDSIYVDIDDNNIDTAKETQKILNEHVRKSFPNVLGLTEHPVTLEFEKYFKSLGVGATKNRNAGLITWKDGSFLDKEEFVMTGFTAKRVSLTKLAKDVQLEVLNMWVEGKNEEEVTSFLNDKYNSVMNGDIPLSDVLQRSRYRENRFQVECKNCFRKNDLFTLTKTPCCTATPRNFTTLEGKRPTIGSGIAGVLFSHANGYEEINDTYLYLKIKSNKTFFNPITGIDVKATYVSLLVEEDFYDYDPDWSHYAESVVKKAEPIYRAMGWDTKKITADNKQSSLEEWF